MADDFKEQVKDTLNDPARGTQSTSRDELRKKSEQLQKEDQEKNQM